MKTIVKYVVVLLVVLSGGCFVREGIRSDNMLRVVVFVEATDQENINQKIEQKYLRPIYQRFVSSSSPFDLTIFPISGNTSAETPLLHVAHEDEWMTEEDQAELADSFRQLRQQYSQVYPPGSAYLVDVLGTAVLLDNYLGVNAPANVEVLYISDMVQQGDVDGYDFTEYARGKSLEQCKQELQERVGPNLRNRSLFAHARVHIVHIGIDTLRRGGGPSAGSVTRNADKINIFWTRDFFGSFLRAREVLSYSGSVENALDLVMKSR